MTSASTPLVLLFGLPRSGTTWIGKILDSHPDTYYCHEPDTAASFRDVPPIAGRGDEGAYGEIARRFVQDLPRIRRPKVAASVPVFPKSYYPPWRNFCRRIGLPAVKSMERLGRVRRIPRFLAPGPSGCAAVVWKSIESAGRTGLIAAAVREARPVVILRHPCGHVASVLRGERLAQFSSPQRQSQDIAFLRDLAGTETGRRYSLETKDLEGASPLECLTWRWILLNDAAIEGANRSGGLVLRYEDVCADPPGRAKALLEWVGLSWHPQCEAFIESSSRGGRNGSYYGLYKNPEAAAHRWKQELTPQQIRDVLNLTEGTRPGRLYEGDA